MRQEAPERMVELRRQVGANDHSIIESLLLRGIEDTSPLTLRKLFPDKFSGARPDKNPKLHKVTIRIGGEESTAYAQPDEAKRMIATFKKSTVLWTKSNELENQLRVVKDELEPYLVEKTVVMVDGKPEAV
jgi:hypothetical protein